VARSTECRAVAHHDDVTFGIVFDGWCTGNHEIGAQPRLFELT
jgi:hypothetical protein